MRLRTQRRLSLGLLTAAGLLLMAEAAVSVLARRTLLAWEAPVPVTKTGAPYLPGNPYLLWEMVPGTRTEMGATVTVNSLGRSPGDQAIRREARGGARRLHCVRTRGRGR